MGIPSINPISFLEITRNHGNHAKTCQSPPNPAAAKSRQIPPNPAKSRQIPPNPAESRQIPPNPAKSRQIPPNPAKSRQVPPIPAKSGEITPNHVKPCGDSQDYCVASVEGTYLGGFGDWAISGHHDVYSTLRGLLKSPNRVIYLSWVM